MFQTIHRVFYCAILLDSFPAAASLVYCPKKSTHFVQLSAFINIGVKLWGKQESVYAIDYCLAKYYASIIWNPDGVFSWTWCIHWLLVAYEPYFHCTFLLTESLEEMELARLQATWYIEWNEDPRNDILFVCYWIY
jgi:hypothetical protein